MFSTVKLSGSMGVWKPCRPFHVMFLRDQRMRMEEKWSIRVGDVLDSDTRALSDENEILSSSGSAIAPHDIDFEAYRESMDDHGSDALFDDIGRHTQCRGNALIASREADGSI